MILNNSVSNNALQAQTPVSTALALSADKTSAIMLTPNEKWVRAIRLSTYAVVARLAPPLKSGLRMGIPLQGLSLDCATWADVVATHPLPHIALMAEVVGEMAVMQSQGLPLNDDYIGGSLPDHIEQQLFDLLPSLWQDEDETDCVAAKKMRNAYWYYAARILAQNTSVITELTGALRLGNLVLTGEEAETMVDALLEVAAEYKLEHLTKGGRYL